MSSQTTDGPRLSAHVESDDDSLADEGEVVEFESPSSGITPGRVIVALVAVAAIVAIDLALDPSLLNGSSTASTDVLGSSSSVPRVGQPAPDFQLPDLDGKTVKLSDFKGQPVWINFWATWCPPCRAETPDVEAAYEQNHPRGLTLLAISVGEDAATVRTYVKSAGMTSTVLLDSSEAVASRYGVNGFPTHLFIDKTGVIRDFVSGGLSRSSITQRLTLIMR